MNPLIKYLKDNLACQVLSGETSCQQFSTDASPLAIQPKVVIYPRSDYDISQVLVLMSQLALKKPKHKLGLTVRGGGSDMNGASLGSGVILNLSAYLNNYDSESSQPGKNLFMFQTGIRNSAVSNLLATQDRHIPALPANKEVSTLGGALANNSGSRLSGKYGRLVNYVAGLRVVLSTGKVIELEDLSPGQVQEKMSLSGFEGDIYRELDNLLRHEDSPYKDCLAGLEAGNHYLGYNLAGLINGRGGFNLIPLFLGSQGTLGVVTSALLACETMPESQQTVCFVCPKFEVLSELAPDLIALQPASSDVFDYKTFAAVKKLKPGLLQALDLKLTKGQLLVCLEFDDSGYGLRKRLKKLVQILDSQGLAHQTVELKAELPFIEAFYQALANLLADDDADRPYSLNFGDIYLPVEIWPEFYRQTMDFFKAHKLDFLAWGQVGLERIQLAVSLGMSGLADKRKYLKLLEDFAKLVIANGGSPSYLYSEGRLKGQWLAPQIEPKLLELSTKLKTLFDPYGILNPGIKLDGQAAVSADSLTLSGYLDHLHRQPHIH